MAETRGAGPEILVPYSERRRRIHVGLLRWQGFVYPELYVRGDDMARDAPDPRWWKLLACALDWPTLRTHTLSVDLDGALSTVASSAARVLAGLEDAAAAGTTVLAWGESPQFRALVDDRPAGPRVRRVEAGVPRAGAGGSETTAVQVPASVVCTDDRELRARGARRVRRTPRRRQGRLRGGRLRHGHDRPRLAGHREHGRASAREPAPFGHDVQDMAAPGAGVRAAQPRRNRRSHGRRRGPRRRDDRGSAAPRR